MGCFKRGLAAILLVLTAGTSTSSTPPTLTKSFSLYHSLNSHDFAPRGVVTLSSTEGGVTAEVESDETCAVDPAEVDALVESGGLYRLKVVDGESGAVAMASVAGCSLRRSNFREEIGLTLSPTGTLLSVSYVPLVSPLAPTCESLSPLLSSSEGSSAEDSSSGESAPNSQQQQPRFQTTVTYETATPGMTVPLVLPQSRPPPGLKFYPRRDLKDGVGGVPSQFQDEKDKPESKSFVRRYWYILLPMGIMLLTGGQEEEEPQQQQRSGQQQRAVGGAPSGGAGAAPGGSGGAASAGGGGGGAPKQRRGKRG